MSIFPDKKTSAPTGFALGSIEGRVAIHYVNPQNPKDNFTFKCHRSNGTAGGVQDIYAVSDIDVTFTTCLELSLHVLYILCLSLHSRCLHLSYLGQFDILVGLFLPCLILFNIMRSIIYLCDSL